jgi:hypothetical protein
VLLGYVYAPDGRMIYRDRDKNEFGGNPFASGGYPTAAGLDEREYALYDAAGSTTALVAASGVYIPDATSGTTTAAAGQVVERFVYDQDGLPTALREDYTHWDSAPSLAFPITRDQSHYSFEQRYHGQRFHLLLENNPGTGFAGLYEGSGGQFYDPQNGKLITPNLVSLATGDNAYDPMKGWSSWERFSANLGIGIHSTLDFIGTIDPVGIADLTNAGLYLFTGEYKQAGISAAGAILPYAGDALKATRAVKWLHAAADEFSVACGLERAMTSRLFCTAASGITGAGIGAASGFVYGSVNGLIATGTWGGAWESGLAGAEFGALQGGIGNAARGFVNPYVCFVAGTRVVVDVENACDRAGELMSEAAEGSTATAKRLRYKTMAIEDLVARGGGEMGDGGGQFVISRDQHDPDGPLVRRRITRTYQRTAYHLQVLTLRDEAGIEQTIRVTDEHPFYVAGKGWVAARLLRPQDTLLGAHGILTVIGNDGKAHPHGVAVYNLEIEQAHTYFVLAEDAPDAAGVWVHNANYVEPAKGAKPRYSPDPEKSVKNGALSGMKWMGLGSTRIPKASQCIILKAFRTLKVRDSSGKA